MHCEEKNKYSKSTAEKVRDDVRKKTGKKMKIYQCVVCKCWHITKKTKWLKKWDKYVK